MVYQARIRAFSLDGIQDILVSPHLEELAPDLDVPECFQKAGIMDIVPDHGDGFSRHVLEGDGHGAARHK